MGSEDAHRAEHDSVLGNYWETEDPRRTLRQIADSQEAFDTQFKQLIESAAPAINLSEEQPLSHELLFTWPIP